MMKLSNETVYTEVYNGMHSGKKCRKTFAGRGDIQTKIKHKTLILFLKSVGIVHLNTCTHDKCMYCIFLHM